MILFVQAFLLFLNGQVYICSLSDRINAVLKLHLHNFGPLHVQSIEPIPSQSVVGNAFTVVYQFPALMSAEITIWISFWVPYFFLLCRNMPWTRYTQHRSTWQTTWIQVVMSWDSQVHMSSRLSTTRTHTELSGWYTLGSRMGQHTIYWNIACMSKRYLAVFSKVIFGQSIIVTCQCWKPMKFYSQFFEFLWNVRRKFL